MQPSLRLRQVTRLLAAIAVTLVGGTIGFHETLGETWFQALYRSVVTATLAGLDTIPRNNGARVVSMILVFCGLTIIAYAGAVIVEAIAGGVFTGVLAERRREKTIERLRDHFIICGYGRVGRQVADEFRAAGVSYVVLDFSQEAVANAKEHGDLLIEGDATEDEDLRRAGLERADGIVVASDDDADNLYITLSARSVQPNIQIVARASDEDAAKKRQEKRDDPDLDKDEREKLDREQDAAAQRQKEREEQIKDVKERAQRLAEPPPGFSEQLLIQVVGIDVGLSSRLGREFLAQIRPQ